MVLASSDPHTSGYGGFIGRTAIMAIVGGTASALGGGKFANGAVSGAFVHMFNAEAVVRNTISAVKRYFTGNGGVVELGEQTKQELKNHPLVQRQIQALKDGRAKYLNGNLSVDLTYDTYHIGETGVVFNTSCSNESCTTYFLGFVQAANGGSIATSLDSFSDPLDIGIEIWGGTPYYYMPYAWSITYENKF